jgi:hypothetical protein
MVAPRLTGLPMRLSMLVGFLGFIAGQILLVTMPAQNYILLALSVILEASSAALINPLVDSMVVVTVDPQERARIMAILYAVVLTVLPWYNRRRAFAGKPPCPSCPSLLYTIKCFWSCLLPGSLQKKAGQPGATPRLSLNTV